VVARKIAIVAVLALLGAVLAQVPSGTAALAPAGVQTNDQAKFSFSRDGSPKPGDLDPTFGGDGVVITDLGEREQAFATAIQRDGKIVVGGIVMNPYGYTDFLVLRYRVDGVLDRSFGNGGYVRTDFGGYYDALAAIAIQPDGKIVAAGSSYDYGADAGYFALARYNADGSLDSAFGSGGKVWTGTWRVPGGSPIGTGAAALVLQPDGKIVAAGKARVSYVNWNSDFGLVRYKPDGSLDEGFGAGGKVLTSFSSSQDFAVGVALDPRGRIVAGGTAGSYSAVARYEPDGDLDASFGAGGKATTLERDAAFRRGLALQPDGKVILGGSSLIRYSANGSLDTGFGSGGQVDLHMAGGALAIQSDGRIVAVGGSGGRIQVKRYKRNGAVDASFGRRGMTTTWQLGAQGSAYSVSLQSDGRIVVAGGTWSGAPRSSWPADVAIVRYLNPAMFRVPNVRGKKLVVARSVITKAHCRVGKVTRKTSKSVKRNRVISQSPKAGTYLPRLGKVNLVISKGQR
jgi:uncharacterized delta-60 repeat protein